MVKNLPCNAVDMGFILGWETKILHAEEQLRWHAATREPMCHKERSHMMQ